MGSHADCSNWDYVKHPNVATVGACCTALIAGLRQNPAGLSPFLADTRPAHHQMFEGVVPAACAHLAGNYRGADFPALKNYRVTIAGEEGMIPAAVALAMDLMHADLQRDLASIDAARSQPNADQHSLDLLLVEFLSLHMVKFLTIHPYANGNGHIGRLLMWIGLGRSGLWPKSWNLNARPGWDELIARHRRGQTKPLIKFVLRSI